MALNDQWDEIQAPNPGVHRDFWPEHHSPLQPHFPQSSSHPCCFLKHAMAFPKKLYCYCILSFSKNPSLCWTPSNSFITSAASFNISSLALLEVRAPVLGLLLSKKTPVMLGYNHPWISKLELLLIINLACWCFYSNHVFQRLVH